MRQNLPHPPPRSAQSSMGSKTPAGPGCNASSCRSAVRGVAIEERVVLCGDVFVGQESEEGLPGRGGTTEN